MPPLAKRSTERRRRNKVPGESVVVLDGTVSIPKLPPNLDPIAVRWYNALKRSGQSQFFEPSDWAAAIFVAETITRMLEAEDVSASLFASVWSAMNDLMTTEASRRRLKVEVERKADEPDTGPTALDEYRKRLAK